MCVCVCGGRRRDARGIDWRVGVCMDVEMGRRRKGDIGRAAGGNKYLLSNNIDIELTAIRSDKYIIQYLRSILKEDQTVI